MKHYLYKITNTLTKEYYVGVRSNKCPELDKYMGSSSIWTKDWVKQNKDILLKEILDDSFIDRDSANRQEVILLKSLEQDPLCINKLFDIIPSHLGRKQSLQWIKKRIKSGKDANMYGKHHSDETKKQISEKLKGHIVTEETRNKISKSKKGVPASEERKLKASITMKNKVEQGTYKKTYKKVIVEDLVLCTIEEYDGCKIFADKFNLNYGSVKAAALKGNIYQKRYKIKYAASISDDSCKLGELLETPEVDNQQPSLSSNTFEGSTTNIRVLSDSSEDSNNNTSAQLLI